ncbi:hypothetical protein AABB24_012739 [Solanum stoloniferum]|uniref:Uncharacterized protein n=1 Tax=Solanum stoloniferum TaxID=62892 RepID=A0ABD2U4A9_9SOLN
MATAEVENREWYVASYASTGVPNSDHIKLRTVTLSLRAECIPDNHVAFQILYVSIDPYMRTQLSGLDDGLSLPQIPLGQVYYVLTLFQFMYLSLIEYKLFYYI